MKEKENQTPRKELPRSSDLVHRRSKDSPAKKTSKKIAQKSLTEVFVFEDVLPEISEEFIDFSSVSAVSDANHNGETGERSVIASCPSLSASSEAFTPYELTPCSNMSTVERSVIASCSSLSASSEAFTPSELTPCSKMSTANIDDQIGFPKTALAEVSEAFTPSELTPCLKMSTVIIDDQIGFPKTGSAEVEIIVNLLEQARLQALNSINMEDKSKKVLDALIKFAINEFYTMSQERDLLPEHIARNAYVRFLCLVLMIVAVSLFSFYLFCYSRVPGSSNGKPPT